ncbi:hypothetical protein SMICM17S_00508 [Streptomyces microflavus]
MTTGRLGLGAPPGRQAGGQAAPPNAAYAGQVVHFPDPVRAARHPRGVRVDERGYPDFLPYARAAAEIRPSRPEGFGVDELRLTDYVSANAALAASGHELWDTIPAVATPHGWTWHHVVGSRRMELVRVEVKALLRHQSAAAHRSADRRGPGYQAVLRFRAPDGSEQQLIRRSAPGTPHPEWQMLHELRAMNVPPQQVIELHTELESCELPGGYCARMIRETWPQVRITSVAPYGTDHASRQQGMQHLLTHQGELHQVADGPARPAPVRAPLPQMPPAPVLPPEAVAEELLQAFGPQGILRFDQRAVSRQGVPEIVARTLVWAGLPADFGPFFWAQPGQPVVPTLGEVAAQRQVQAAPDAGAYLVMGTDFGRAICVQYGTANIVAVPVEAGPGGQSVAPQFVNTGLPEFVRSMALLGRMWRLRFGLTPEQAGRWTVDFQAQLVALDPAALASPESWWSVLLEQMWDGLL